MLYWAFPDLNPLLPTFLIGPLLAILLGAVCRRIGLNAVWPISLSLLLPVLFIFTNLETLKANIDAWLVYGIVYAILSVGAYKLSKSSRKNA
ncbi:hypothetical protein SABR111722_13350 [Saccharibacillus brassicae]